MGTSTETDWENRPSRVRKSFFLSLTTVYFLHLSDFFLVFFLCCWASVCTFIPSASVSLLLWPLANRFYCITTFVPLSFLFERISLVLALSISISLSLSFINVFSFRKNYRVVFPWKYLNMCAVCNFNSLFDLWLDRVCLCICLQDLHLNVSRFLGRNCVLFFEKKNTNKSISM